MYPGGMISLPALIRSRHFAHFRNLLFRNVVQLQCLLECIVCFGRVVRAAGCLIDARRNGNILTQYLLLVRGQMAGAVCEEKENGGTRNREEHSIQQPRIPMPFADPEFASD